MNIKKIGGWTIICGVLAVCLAYVFGAGPCNATITGLILMLLGSLAVLAGGIMLVIGFIIRARAARTT